MYVKMVKFQNRRLSLLSVKPNLTLKVRKSQKQSMVWYP